MMILELRVLKHLNSKRVELPHFDRSRAKLVYLLSNQIVLPSNKALRDACHLVTEGLGRVILKSLVSSGHIKIEPIDGKRYICTIFTEI